MFIISSTALLLSLPDNNIKKLYKFFKINFYWSILLYNIVLISTVQQSGCHTSPLFGFPFHLGHRRRQVEFTLLYSRVSLVVCLLLGKSLYISPNLPIPSTLLPHGVHMFVSVSTNLYFYFLKSHHTIFSRFHTTYACYCTTFVFLFLVLLPYSILPNDL